MSRILYRLCRSGYPRLTRSLVCAIFIAILVIVNIFISDVLFSRASDYPIVMVASPVVSPSGDKVAFAAARANERDFHSAIEGDPEDFGRAAETLDIRLWIISLTDGTARDTRTEIFNGGHPLTWSPDESRIAFVSGMIDEADPSSFMRLDSLDLHTGTATSVVPARVFSPRFSPDGVYLGYVSQSDSTPESRSMTILDVKKRDRKVIALGVSPRHWCWSPDATSLFYVRREQVLCQYDLETQSERVLFAAPENERKFPTYPMCSPDGKLLGYLYDGWFRTIDLSSGKSEKRLSCGHFFSDFDWNDAGICYVAVVNGERKKLARLMIYNPKAGHSTAVATGPFSFPRWVRKKEILVRKGNTELWTYRVSDGKGIRVFGSSDQMQ